MMDRKEFLGSAVGAAALARVGRHPDDPDAETWMQVMEERRFLGVVVPQEHFISLLEGALRLRYQPTDGVPLSHGLPEAWPESAKVIRVWHDQTRDAFVALFAHPSFRQHGAGAEIEVSSNWQYVPCAD